MTNPIDISPPIGQLNLSPVRAAWPVLAATHNAAHDTANWLLARGVPLVVDGGFVWQAADSSAQTRTLNYRAWIDDIHPIYSVFIVASCDSTAVLMVNDNPATLSVLPLNLHFAGDNTVGSGEIDITLEFSWAGSAEPPTIYIHNIYVYEAALGYLPDSVGVKSVEPSQLIFDGATDRESISGLTRVHEELRASYFRRGAMFSWAVDSADEDETILIGDTYENLFGVESGIDFALQNRLMYANETRRRVQVSVYAKVGSGTGNVRITALSGDVLTLNVTASDYAWHDGELEVETDDPSLWSGSGKGIQGGTRDVITIERRGAGGEESISVAAVCIYDIPGD